MNWLVTINLHSGESIYLTVVHTHEAGANRLAEDIAIKLDGDVENVQRVDEA